MAKVEITRTVTQEVEIPDRVMGIVEGFVNAHEVRMTSSTSGSVERVFAPITYEDIITLVVDICGTYESDSDHRSVLRD